MKTLIQISLITAIGLLGAGCTKEKPYQQLDENTKDGVESVSSFRPVLHKDSKAAKAGKVEQRSDDQVYIMMVSNIGADRISPAITYYKGYSGKVVFDLTEEGKLKVVSKAENFQTNELNDKEILSIGVEHLDFRCATDDFGKCTNREELDSDAMWYDKKFIRPNFSAIASTAPLIDIELDGYFNSGCLSESPTMELKEYRNEDNGASRNIVVERTFSILARCLRNIRSYNDLSDPNNFTFKVKQNYSFTLLSNLANPLYRKMPAALAKAGDNTTEFGFFQTEKKIYDASNNLEQRDEKLINRWDPNKRSIVYYMSQNFNEPHNAQLKKMTHHAANLVNLALEEADAKIRIELRDPDPTKLDGDVRYSQVLLSEDPIQRGLLGYGPVVTNPDTGEILTGRVAMYSGIIKKTVRGAYNDVIQLADQNDRLTPQQRNQLTNQTETARSSVNMEMLTGLDFENLVGNFTEKSLYVTPLRPELLSGMQDKTAIFDVVRQSPGFGSFTENPEGNLVSLSTDFLNEELDEMGEIKFFSAYEKNKEAYMRETFYPVEMFNAHAAIDDRIDVIIEKFGRKPWLPNSPEYANVSNKLSEAEKQEIIDLMVPALYVPTLVHEWGHNLGLRHNFMGSFDKGNFYAHAHDHDLEDIEESNAVDVKDDLALFKKLGIKRKLEYSSIMDYAYGTMNELNIFGKYDVAALRFAYGFAEDPRTLALENSALQFIKKDESGNIIEKKTVSNTPKAISYALEDGYELRTFDFCTDDGVSLNATCNRFDEGTSFTEVVDHYTQAYEDNYVRRNMRNGRRYFDKGRGDIGYMFRLRDQFRTLRLNFELYERIVNKFGLEPTNPQWFTDEQLKDIRIAAVKSGKFFLNVIKTPDAICRISPRANPFDTFKAVPQIPLAAFNGRFAHCGEVQLRPDLIVSGQIGKSLNSMKSRNNPSSFIDEVDVRGIWIDKLLATQALFKRDTGLASDEFDQNYLSLPELQSDIRRTIDAILTDKLRAEVQVNMEPVFSSDPDLAIGGSIVEPITYSLFSDDAGLIKKPLVRGLGRFLGLPNRNATLQGELVDIILESARSDTDTGTRRFMETYASVKMTRRFLTSIDTDAFESDGGKVMEDPELDAVYWADKDNVSARRAIRFFRQTNLEDENSTSVVVNSFLNKGLEGLDPNDPGDRQLIDSIKLENRMEAIDVAIKRQQAEGENEELDPEEFPEEQRPLLKADLEVMIAVVTNTVKDQSFYLESLRALAQNRD